MAKEFFEDRRFQEHALSTIALCNDIVEEYQQQGYRLTLRQLYYQLVSRDVIANTSKEYSKLSSVISKARLAGFVDWDAIEDRVRVPRKHAEFDSLSNLVDAAIYSYRLPRWKGQKHYVELWVEKDALAGVLEPITRDYHITLMVNRGYSSQSAMYESAKRFAGQPQEHKAILYLGDHDPSGEDMVRDINDRFIMFNEPVTVVKIALTMNQIKQYKPPPNPAKITDPRADKYIKKYGAISWEVDALPPQVLVKTITTALNKLIDKPVMDKIIDKENTDKEWLRKIVTRRK